MHISLLSTLLATGLVATCLGHTPICVCPLSKYCLNIIACSDGLKLGYSSPCHCCQDCVIPKGGQCPYYVLRPLLPTPINSVLCEDGTKCCNGICTDEHCTTTTTTEATSETETVTTETETVTAETETVTTETEKVTYSVTK